MGEFVHDILGDGQGDFSSDDCARAKALDRQNYSQSVSKKLRSGRMLTSDVANRGYICRRTNG